MKKLNLLKVLLIVPAILIFYPDVNAQVSNSSGMQIRLKGGIGQTFTALPVVFDEVIIDNPLRMVSTTETDLENTFLETEWGPYGGINLDLYIKPKFGFGLDGDLFFNKLDFIVHERLEGVVDEFDLDALVESNRKNQTFFFAGIGPSFKLVKSKHFDIDFNLRGGLSMLQMGSLSVSLPDFPTKKLLPGALFRTEIFEYDYSRLKMAFGAKAGLYLNFWFNSWIGLTAGADLVHSFVSNDKLMDEGSYNLEYIDPDYFNTDIGEFDKLGYFFVNNELDYYPAGKMNVNHFAASAGLVFRIGGSSPGKAAIKESPSILAPVDEMEVGKTFIIENIYYDFDQCDFREGSTAELDRLVKTMNKYPGMEIELSSHTDQRGAADYNMRLSQCRAESVVEYLADKGISKSRITPVGYGESRLLNDCSSVNGCGDTGDTDCPCHKMNRRTEVKVLKL